MFSYLFSRSSYVLYVINYNIPNWRSNYSRKKASLKEPEGSIFGSLLETQPVERHSTKYGDNLWPSHDYPTYVSGGGFLMNRKAAMALQELSVVAEVTLSPCHT